MPRLSATSYALLGLLERRDWTAYELARQMEQELGHVWPRAQSGIYAEPRSLVAHGLATATTQRSGKRSRTSYAISDDGRRALAAWLRGDPAPATFVSEAALQIVFSDGKANALKAIDALDEDARTRDESLREPAAAHPDSGSPSRDRAAAIAAQLRHEHHAATRRWARWARDEVGSWPSTEGTEGTVEDPTAIDRGQVGRST